MGLRPKVSQLPEPLRDELDRRLQENHFSQYVKLAAWLTSEGYPISHGSLHRYGAKRQKRLQAIEDQTRAAAMIAEMAPDDAAEREAALMALLQSRFFEVLTTLQAAKGLPLEKKLKMLVGAIPAAVGLAGASLDQKRHARAVHERVTKAAAAVTAQARKEGLSEGLVRQIRAEILSIAREGEET